MCHFITLIAATPDRAALDAVLMRHGRHAQPIENASVANVLAPGEQQYLATHRNGCDCGTVLGRMDALSRDERLERDLAAEAERLGRKGWAPAKVARAIDDKRRAAARSDGGLDSADFWAGLLTEVGASLKLSQVGLLVHLYSGALDQPFDVARDVRRWDEPLQAAVEAMREDTVTIFRTA